MRNKSGGRSSAGPSRSSRSSYGSNSIVPVRQSTPQAPPRPAGSPAHTGSPSLFSTFASSAAGAVAGNALSGLFHGSESAVQNESAQSGAVDVIPPSSTVAQQASVGNHPCAALINDFIYCAENIGQGQCTRQWETFEQCHYQNPTWF